MRSIYILVVAAVFTGLVPAWGEAPVFEDTFKGPKLKEGWSWVREAPKEWRLKDGALELRAQPGKIWAGNDAKNVMLWDTPAEGDFSAEVSVTQKPDQLLFHTTT